MIRADSVGLLDRMLRNRRLVRAPIPLFRAGLGWIFGGRVFLLQHTGRRSGEPRFVVLEAVERPERGVVRAVAGMGRGSQWYRNLKADPRCRITLLRRSVPATAEELPVEQGRELLQRYRAEHPRAAAQLFAVLERNTPPGRQIWDACPVIEFRRDPEPSRAGRSAWQELMGPVRAGEAALTLLAAGLVAIAAAGGPRPRRPVDRALRALTGADIGRGLVAFALPTTREHYAGTGDRERLRFTAAHLHPYLLQSPRRALATHLGILGAATLVRAVPPRLRAVAGAVLAGALTWADGPRPDWLLAALRVKLLVGHASLPPSPDGEGKALKGPVI